VVKLTCAQSILAHLPEHINPDSTRVFVLIYAPDMKTHPLSAISSSNNGQGPKPSRSSQSMASSFSNISQTDAQQTPAQTPGEFPTNDDDQGILASVSPHPIVEETSSLFKTLYNQALAIVERETMILPFSSEKGHRNILKSLTPEVVYMQESLCGRDGELVADVGGWVRQVVVVIGDEGGAGGLVDTTDDEGARRRNGDGGKSVGGQKWWMREERTGLGKRVAVVEGVKVGDDWRRRINEID
jgi:hypothetical protein